MESKPHHLCEWVQTFWKKKLMATVLGNNKLIRRTKVSALLRKRAKVFGKSEWMTSNWCCIVCFCVGSSEIKRCFKNALSYLYLKILQGSCFTSSELEARHRQILVFAKELKDQCFMLELRNCFFICTSVLLATEKYTARTIEELIMKTINRHWLTPTLVPFWSHRHRRSLACFYAWPFICFGELNLALRF